VTAPLALPWRQRTANESERAAGVTLPLAVLAAALGPAYVLRWHVGPLPTTALEAALLATFAVFVVARGRAVEWRCAVTVPAVLFLVAGAVSVVVAPSRLAALGLYRAYLVEPVIFAIVLLTVLRWPRRAHAVLAGFWAGGAVLALANIAAVAQAVAAHRFSAAATPPVAIYSVNNAVALYLVPLIAVAGAVALHERSRLPRAAAIAFLVVAVAAVLASLSRGGWVALAVVSAGLAISHRRRLLLVPAVAVVGAALTQVPAIGQRVALEMRVGSDETFSGRLRLWSASLDMLRHHPILGAGMAGFVHAMGAVLATFQVPPIYPHNLFLNFWSETGLLGLSAFCAILVVTLVASWRGWRGGSAGWRPLQLGVFLALLAVVVHGLVDVPYFKNDLSLEFWALVGIAMAGQRWGRSA
jgi:O-antigen ligase